MKNLYELAKQMTQERGLQLRPTTTQIDLFRDAIVHGEIPAVPGIQASIARGQNATIGYLGTPTLDFDDPSYSENLFIEANGRTTRVEFFFSDSQYSEESEEVDSLSVGIALTSRDEDLERTLKKLGVEHPSVPASTYHIDLMRGYKPEEESQEANPLVLIRTALTMLLHEQKPYNPKDVS